jgi:twinkle protein
MRPSTISELLAAADIRMKRIPSPGRNAKIVCPKCGGGRTTETSLSLAVDADGEGATWRCHRGSCGWQDGARISRGSYVPHRTVPQHQEPPPYEPENDDRPEALYNFFRHRGIGAETVNYFGLYVAERGFRIGDKWEKRPCIVFPYLFGGKLANRKFRALTDKNVMAQEKEPLPTLFNIDAVTADDVLIWVEGEPDVMALHEAGYRQVVTLKDGAPDKLRDEDDPARATDKRFASLSTHADKLTGIKKVILAGDNDAPGRNLREELARRLGRHRCWTVEWPDDCKDAGDALRLHGAEVVQQCIEAARPWPIDGIIAVTADSLEDHVNRPAPPVMTTGIESVDRVVKLPGEGRVIIVTGFPNSGKSAWTRYVMIHTMQRHNRRWLVFTPEMAPVMEFAAQAAQILIGKPARRIWERPDLEPMTREQLRSAGEWLNGRLSFLATDAEDNPPSVDWILERARDAVLRLGVTDLLIDPFNEIEQVDSQRETETSFIGRTIQRFRAFGQRHGCNVWIVAHPAKPLRNKDNEAPKAPGPYDISGSAHWNNKADLGLTIHRPEDVTHLIVWKSRFHRWGQKNTGAIMAYDVETCRYRAA